MLLPFFAAVPFDGALTALIDIGSPSGSLSFASTLIVTAVLPRVDAWSSFAFGAPFGAWHLVDCRPLKVMSSTNQPVLPLLPSVFVLQRSSAVLPPSAPRFTTTCVI